MAYSTKEPLVCQLQCEVETLQASEGLPFRELLSEERILRRGGCWADFSRADLHADDNHLRGAFPGPMRQVLLVLRRGQPRDRRSQCAWQEALLERHLQLLHGAVRLPEQMLVDLAEEAGQELHRQAAPEWLWKGRHVQLVDGSTATMDDTEPNQAEYPQSTGQKKGLGFPVLRFVVLLSLATGSVLECAIGACRGKKTGEQSLFRRMGKSLKPGDILLGDRLYDCYRDIAMLKARGVDTVFGKKSSRQCDFRRGRRLGRKDHVVVWKKPSYDASRYESRAEWEALPAQIEMREVSVEVRRHGYRTRTITVVTTLLDDQYSAKDLTDLFAQRWNCELDLRSIKCALSMHHINGRTPQSVRKQLWLHLLAYNLVRVRMAQAAQLHEKTPRCLSFTAATKLIHHFAPHLHISQGEQKMHIEHQLLAAIAASPVDPRPGRQEPRAVKKRMQKFPYLKKPRSEYKPTKELTP